MSDILIPPNAQRVDSREVGRAIGRRIPGEVGIWVFVIGDMTMFAAFFGIYTQARSRQPALFNASQHQLLISFGAINTCLLLTGSLFVVWGVQATRDGKHAVAPRMFAAALSCASLFGFNKIIEYSIKLGHGITPATNEFFMYFFMYTGIHALHLLIGMCVLARMRRTAAKPVLDASDVNIIESGATYWHLVDLLWVVLFALLYLMN